MPKGIPKSGERKKYVRKKGQRAPFNPPQEVRMGAPDIGETALKLVRIWEEHPDWNGREVCMEAQVNYGWLVHLQKLHEGLGKLYWEHATCFDRLSKDEVEGIRYNAAQIFNENPLATETEVAEYVGCYVDSLKRWAKENIDHFYTTAYNRADVAKKQFSPDGLLVHARDNLEILTPENVGIMKHLSQSVQKSRTLELPEGSGDIQINIASPKCAD